jgi:7-keto-8-aminopelargonate synthetase-like enzyme
MILVDDAHGAGVLGARGRGTPEAEGVGRGRIVQCVTLSKAFGAHGGAVLGTRAVRRAIVDRSRVFAGSTPVPLPVANAALAAVGIMTRDRARLLRLRANTQRLKAALKAAGIDAAAGPVPIVPFHPGSARGAAASKRALLAAGIYPPFVRYPGAPADGLFRFVVSSEHTPAQLDALAAVLVEASSHST